MWLHRGWWNTCNDVVTFSFLFLFYLLFIFCTCYSSHKGTRTWHGQISVLCHLTTHMPFLGMPSILLSAPRLGILGTIHYKYPLYFCLVSAVTSVSLVSKPLQLIEYKT